MLEGVLKMWRIESALDERLEDDIHNDSPVQGSKRVCKLTLLLREGWEPFGVTMESGYYKVWLKKQVGGPT